MLVKDLMSELSKLNPDAEVNLLAKTFDDDFLRYQTVYVFDTENSIDIVGYDGRIDNEDDDED